jgi:hypothetical protein
MSDPKLAEFHKLLDQSMAELQFKTAAHSGLWHLGSADWQVNQEEQTIIFTSVMQTQNEISAINQGQSADLDSFAVIVTCPVQIIGSFDTLNSSWMWSWGNSSIIPELQQHALEVKAYGKKHDIELLTERIFECEEYEAWEFTALAAKLNNAEGAYRGPAGTTLLFMTFGTPSIARVTAPHI